MRTCTSSNIHASKQFTNAMVLLHPTPVFNLISETQPLYHNLLCNYRIPCYCVLTTVMRDFFISKQPALFRRICSCVTCNDLPLYDAQAWFPAPHTLPTLPPFPPTITSCPRGKKCWEVEVAIFLLQWILHMPQLKSITGEGERSGKRSGTILVHWFRLWRDGPGIALVSCYTPYAEARLFSDHCSHFGSSRKSLWLESESEEQPWRNLLALPSMKQIRLTLL